jgi:hypothetical protein
MQRRIRFAVLLLVASLAAPAAVAQTKPATTGAAPLRVLIIGDGYSLANGGLDHAVNAIAKLKGRSIQCSSSTAAGQTLQWHWEAGAARKLIADGKWDYVVLQHAPVEQTAEAILLVSTLDQFAAEARKVGARALVLDTVADAVKSKAQRTLERSSQRLTQKSPLAIVPVGSAIRWAREDRQELMTGGAGRGEQPRPEETYAAACVLYAVLSDDTTESLPPTLKTATGKPLTIAEADAAAIQRAADMETATSVPPTTVPAAFGTGNDSVVFVVDATGTMLGLKFTLAKQHLRERVSALAPPQRFNVMFFQGGDTDAEWMRPFARELLPADVANKTKVLAFVDSAEVVGKGTNPLPALRFAFGQRPDALVFISDGEFDNVVGFDQVISAVRKFNAKRRMRFEAVALMSEDVRGDATLQTLARENGGTFTRLSDKGVGPATRPSHP